jgi:hypothetical protein
LAFQSLSSLEVKKLNEIKTQVTENITENTTTENSTTENGVDLINSTDGSNSTGDNQ